MRITRRTSPDFIQPGQTQPQAFPADDLRSSCIQPFNSFGHDTNGSKLQFQSRSYSSHEQC